MRLMIYDTTLREGMQSVGTAFTLKDKIRIAQLLDELGVSYIEGGSPASNPKDAEFYRAMRKLPLKHGKLTAFGATCRVRLHPAEDPAIAALMNAGTDAVCVFGKSWDVQVRDVLRVTLEENLKIIEDTVSYLKQRGKEVIYDAEHFFNAYRTNPAYAIQSVQRAADAGADFVVLCDTNGGSFPAQISAATAAAAAALGPDIKIGIHCHNDCAMAEANAVTAVCAGAVMVHTTLKGIGERCGNTDFFTAVPNLQLKLGYACIPENCLRKLTAYSYAVSDLFNIKPNPRAPYVGQNAFSHKAGMHIDAVVKQPGTFEHINPESVGSVRRLVLSEVSGKAAVLFKIKDILPELSPQQQEAAAAITVEKLKSMEFEGYQFEGAEASFSLLVRKAIHLYRPCFQLRSYKVITSNQPPSGKNATASAIVDVMVDEKEEITAANGTGPVDALDGALRKALAHFYPQIKTMRLVDYKVRVLDSNKATASKVRVFIESSDGKMRWCTVGVSGDIIEASWHALVDAYEYMLMRDAE